MVLVYRSIPITYGRLLYGQWAREKKGGGMLEVVA